MTTTANLHNCAAWTTLTAYTVGQRRSNDSAPVKAYECITAGTSLTGPTGTGVNIADGSVRWKYLSAVDYTSLSAAIAGIGTLSAPTELLFWNDAEWAMNAVAVSGNTTTVTNTLTLKPAAGEGFRSNATATTNPLRYDQSKGVGIASNSNYDGPFSVNQAYVTVFGLQCRGGTASQSYTMGIGTAGGATAVVDSCILDNGAAGNAAPCLANVASTTGGYLFRNTLFVVNVASYAVVAFYAGTYANCTIVRSAITAATGSALQTSYGTGPTVKNAALFGFTSLSSGQTPTFTSCATDIASPPAGVTGGLVYASQFQNTGATASSRDFRAKTGAGLLDAGATDTTNVPAANDITGTARPQGSAWDIGAWELLASGAAYTASITEAGTAADTVSAILSAVSAVTEAGAAADTVSASISGSVSITEAASAADTVSAVSLYSASLSDSAAATDTVSSAAALIASVTETASVLEAVTSTGSFSAVIVETAAAADTVSGPTAPGTPAVLLVVNI